jgi:hypothetical protein
MKNPYSSELGMLVRYLKEGPSLEDFLTFLPVWGGLTKRQQAFWDEHGDHWALAQTLTPKQTTAFKQWAENQDWGAETPTRSMVDFIRVVKRNEWLAHFTDHPELICAYGFKYGQPDLTILALTTHVTEEARKRYPGWNFAFLAEDHRTIKQYGHFYGRHAVLFQSAGVLVDHAADNYRQVVFWGPHVKRVYPVWNESGDWLIRPTDRKELLLNSFAEARDWVETHHKDFPQMGCDV